MLNISEELKAAFLTDSTHKDIQIEFEGGSEKYAFINFTELFDPANKTGSNVALNASLDYLQFVVPYAPGVTLSPVNQCIHDVDYLCITGEFKVNTLTMATGVTAPGYMKIRVQMYHTGGTWSYEYSDAIAYDSASHEFRLEIATEENAYIYGIGVIFYKPDESSYTSSEEASSYAIKWSNMSICLGDDPDQMPFEDTKSIYEINQAGENWIDYINVPVVPAVVTNDYLCQNAFTLTEHICSSNILKFGASEGASCSFDAVGVECDKLVGKYFTASIGCEGITERIPLGRFRVKNVAKEGSYNIVKKHIEAYDGMYPLSMDATDWFGKNIGIFEDVDNGDHINKPISRQPLNTLLNAFDVVNINPEITNISAISGTEYKSLPANMACVRILLNRGTGIYNDNDYVEYSILGYGNSNHFPVDSSKVYRIDLNYDYHQELHDYFEDRVPYGNTFGMYPDNGGIYIHEFDSGQNTLNEYCVDEKQFFAVSPDTSYIIIGIPTKYHVLIENAGGSLVTRELTIGWSDPMYVESGEFIYQSPNWSVPLVYYNWQTTEVAHPTNISFRDVIRSLVEVTGTFFKYNRYGKIQFSEASIDGLYPSETLYPADDLYPRGGANQVLPMARYKSFRCDDSATSDYGKIQIIASDLKTYTGDADKPNVYIMNDNIFYCDSVVTYVMNDDGTESLPQVVEMLTNLYDKIAHVRYTPCKVDMVGLPWVECGDRITLLTDSFGFDSFMFNRVLTGIQVLDDSVEALGETETEQIVELWR